MQGKVLEKEWGKGEFLRKFSLGGSKNTFKSV